MPLSHTAPSLVAVCADGPASVQVTRVPTFIVIVDGANEKSWIVTQLLVQLGDVALVQATETAETPNNTRRGNHINPPQLLGDP